MITGASATSPLQFSQFDLADEEVFMVRNKVWREKNGTGPEIFYLKKIQNFYTNLEDSIVLAQIFVVHDV